MHLVDKQNNVTGLLYLVHGFLNPLLKVATVLCTGHHRGQIQRHDLFAFQQFRHLVLDDLQGQPLGNGGFTNARLTDEAGIVLAAAGQNLNDPLNFLFTTDHRIDLAALGQRSQVTTKLVQRRCLGLALFAGGLAVRLRLLTGEQLLHQHFRAHAQCQQELVPIRIRFLEQRQQQVLCAYKGMHHTAGNLERQLQHPFKPWGKVVRGQPGRLPYADILLDELFHIFGLHTAFTQRLGA